MARRLLGTAALMPGLSFTVVGPGRPSVVFLHGLLGRGRNWAAIAAGLAATGTSSVLFDLPNHGASPWTATFSYPRMVEAVVAEIHDRLGDEPGMVLVGHSMGGKVAMLTALTHPELLRGLAVVDIAPTHSDQLSNFPVLIQAMRTLDLRTLHSRAEADHRLRAEVPDAALRQFLLSNLRERNGWHWQPHLDLFAASLDEIGAWPDPGPLTFSGPTSWVVGARSGYYRPADEALMRRYFPAVRTVVVPQAGHWVHADNPEAMLAALLDLRERSLSPA